MSAQIRRIQSIVISAIAIALIATPSTLLAQVDVWIDPGHGDQDDGAPGYSGQPDGREKILTYEVSSLLYSRLGQIGFSSLKTRNGDNYPTLDRRALMASGNAPNDSGQQEPGQMLVSVHMNSAKTATPFGTETYYPSWKTYAFTIDVIRTDSTFAEAIHSGMMTGANLAFLGCNSNRGVKHAGHIVTIRSLVPAVLVEVCFISNQCQQSKIEAQGNQAVIANGIAAGISNVIVPGGGLISDPRQSRFTANVTASTRIAPSADQVAAVSPHPPPAAQPTATVVQSLSEGFESTTFPPTGWSIQTAGQPDPYRWHRRADPLYVHGGVAAATVGAQSPSAIDEWLISPPVALGGGDSGLRFSWNGNRNHAQAVNATCSIRPTGTGQWTQVWSLQSEPAGTEFRYQERVIDLTPWAGTQIEFAFRVSGTNGAEFVLDDVSIGTYAPTGQPANDTCSGAIAIPAGTHAFTGSTCYGANNLDGIGMLGNCTADSLHAPDVFYWVSAAAGDTLNATATGPWSPVLYLVNICGQGTGTCLSATPTGQDGDISTASLEYVFPSSGVYFLVVDGVTGECGAFELTTRIRSEVTGVETGEDLGTLRPNLTAHPNPSSGSVRFIGHRGLRSEESGVLRIYSVNGRLVCQQRVRLSGDQFGVDWNGRSTTGTQLPSGVYVATITSAHEQIQTRFVLTR